MNNNFPDRFGIWTGKSCERSITTSYLKKVIKIAPNIDNTDNNKYVVCEHMDEFKAYKGSKAIMIFDEEQALNIPEDLPLYAVAYNSDRVHLIRHTFLIKSDLDVEPYIERIRDAFTNVIVYPEVNVKDCDAIVFSSLPPTIAEYYSYIRTITSRDNYKDRAKNGVNVHTYFFITPSHVNNYNNMASKIVERDEKHKQLKKKIGHSIVYANGKIEITSVNK